MKFRTKIPPVRYMHRRDLHSALIIREIRFVCKCSIGDMTQMMHGAANANTVMGMLAKYFAISAVVYAVWFAVCTFLSGRIASRKIDL